MNPRLFGVVKNLKTVAAEVLATKANDRGSVNQSAMAGITFVLFPRTRQDKGIASITAPVIVERIFAYVLQTSVIFHRIISVNLLKGFLEIDKTHPLLRRLDFCIDDPIAIRTKLMPAHQHVTRLVRFLQLLPCP